MVASKLLRRCGIAAVLLPAALQGLADPSEDVFAVVKEPSPREAAVGKEMRMWANRTHRPWDGRRVVAAMTTTPNRIAMIEPALDSLVKQSRPLDVVYLFVPHVFRRDGSTYDLPSWLFAKPRVTVVRCEDSGPATHMLEVLRKERDPGTYILQVDDDQQYGHSLLESLLNAHGPFPGRAIGAATQHAHTHLGGVVLEGVHGVLFQRKFFDPSVFDFEGFSPSCRLHDDLWLSAHLAKRAVHRESLGNRFGSKALHYGFGEDALYRGGAGSDNTRNLYLCMASLVQADPRLWDPADRVVVAAPLLPGFVGRGVDDAGRAVAARELERLRRLRRQPESGPHALYLLGPVPDFEPGEEQLIVPGGAALRAGGWADGLDVFVRECGSECGLAEALDLALEFEEDPEAIIVLFDSPLPKRGLQQILAEHMRCHQTRASGRKGREPCRAGGGSLSFRRHAAYEVGRVQGGIFLPAFSSQFHQPWVEGWHLHDQGLLWRDDNGPWRPAPSKRNVFLGFLGRREEDETIMAFESEWSVSPRRFVAALLVQRADIPRLGATINSLLRQRRRLRRVYVFVAEDVTGSASQRPGRARRRPRPRTCAPAWLTSRPRLLVICGTVSSPAAPLLGLLSRETSPATHVLHLEGIHRYGPDMLANLVRAADLWAGKIVACQGSIFGEHGGPIPSASTGVLYRRSFIDSSLADDVSGPCQDHADLAMAAHFSLKGLETLILGSSFGTRRLATQSHGRRQPSSRDADRTACRKHLVAKHKWLWASKTPERCVLFVSLLQGTDAFLLDLTLRYAGLQTRKPDEVVLLAPHGSIFDLPSPTPRPRAWADAEVVIKGPLGSGTATVCTRDGEALPDAPLLLFLAAMRDRTGTVVRMHSGFGPPRNFQLAVTSCPDGRCSVQPILWQSFERELDPGTALVYTSAERLVNERLVEENVRCLSGCQPHCSSNSWCGQSATRSDGAIYDLTIRRAAGYRDYMTD